jgi:hypothetical protein
MKSRLVMAAALAAAMAPAARGDVIDSDFDPAAPGPYIGGAFVTGASIGAAFGGQSIGLIFAASSSGPLATADVWVQPASEVAGFPAGSYDTRFDLSLYLAPATGAGPGPGPLVADLGDYAAGPGRTVVSASIAAPPTLAAGTDYYLVMSGADASSAVLWMGSTSQGLVYGHDPGLDVVHTTALPTGYLASPAAAVPEPAGLALAGVGVAGLAAARLTRGRRPSTSPSRRGPRA